MKRLLIAFTVAMLCTAVTWAQSDVTSTYLTNADFSSTTDWTQNHSGYYGMLGNGLIGTSVANNKTSTTDATHLSTEYCLGFQCRWSTNYAYYTQTTSSALPVGAYTLTFDVQNTNGSNNVTYVNYFSVTVGGNTYTDASTEWMRGSSVWTTHAISFNVTEAAAATISFGYGMGSNNFGNTATPHLYVSHLKLTWIDPLQAAKDALSAEIAKAQLCDAKEGLASAIAAAQSALETATTQAELEQALADLQAADKDAVLRYENGFADASATNGMLTDLVVNGTFTDNVNGWICTGNFSAQNRTSNQSGDFTVPYFENWNGSAKVNKIYQDINNIPNGTYKLKIAAFVKDLADPNESQYVFANNDKTYLTTGDPTFYEVWTVVTTNAVEIGLEQTTATTNWMGIDNVTLTYYGAGDVIAQAQADAHNTDWAPSFGVGSTITVGEKVESVSAFSTPTDDKNWYIITQVRGGESALYDDGSKLMRGITAATAALFQGAMVEGITAYLVRFISTGTDDIYKIQLGNGHYVAGYDGTPSNSTALSTTSSYSDAGSFAFYNSNGGAGSYFGWNLGSKTGKRVDNNGAGNSLSYWGEGTVSGTSGNNVWYVYPVTINYSDDPQDQNPSEWDDGTGKVYLQNVVSGLWWGAGNSWGTQASLLPHPEYVKLIANGDGTYKMESQVSNGGTQYYFEGDYMDNSSPISLSITKQGEYYTISSTDKETGEPFEYGYEEGSTILGKYVDGDNALWRIYTEDKMMAMMEGATGDNPVDATFLILDPNFGRNNRNVGSWNMVASNYNLSGGENENRCAASNHSTFTLSQTLSDIPNGFYALKAQGLFAQYTGDKENLPVFFANDETTTFLPRNYEEVTLAEASASFSEGYYTIAPILVEVTDGQLTIGARLENNISSWCVWDNFELYYYGTSIPPAYAENLATIVAEAMALEEYLPNSPWQYLYAIVQQYDKEYDTASGYANAIKAIRDAINEIKDIQTAYTEYLNIVSHARNIVSGLNINTDNDKYITWTNVLNEADGVVQNAESVEDIQAVIPNIRKTTVDVIATANITEPIDITSISLKNPDFENETIDGWVCTFVSGETATNIGYQIGYQQRAPYTNGDVSMFHFIEAWQQNTSNKKTIGDGLLYQTIYGLPMGKYRLVTDAIAVDQYQNNNPVEGAYIYIQSGLLETKTEIATGNGLPEHFEVDFINDQADFLTFGLKTESTTANWIAADNFHIFFVEALTESPGVTLLKEKLEEYSDYHIGPCNAEVLTAFEEELEKATAMTTTDIYSAAHSAECIAEVDVLKALYDAVYASENEYTQFQTALNGVTYGEDMEYPVNVELKTLKDQLQQKLDEGTAISTDFEDLATRADGIRQYWTNHLADEDLALLITGKTRMVNSETTTWETPWDLETEVLSLDGVSITGGRVSAIDLSNRGLTGTFPAALMNLKKVTSLNLSGNSLTGNIGVDGTVGTSLTFLNVSGNRFESISPALPSNLTVYLTSQQIPFTWDFDLSQMEDAETLMEQLPSILFYNHSLQSLTNHLTLKAETGGGWQMTLSYENGNIAISSVVSTPYMAANNNELTITSLTGDASGSTFSMRLRFDQGDANFTGDVNVLDLQTIIGYIFNDYTNMFNYTAANLYVDDRINVQDVVRMVDILLEDNEEAGVKAFAFGHPKSMTELEPQATLYWRDNELVLDTEVPVAAADIRIAGSTVTWSLQKQGFTITEKKTGTGSHSIIYSLSGAEIPVGENVIATRGENKNGIVTAMLSSREGTHIPVAIVGQDETRIDKTEIASHAWTLTSIGGAIVARGIGQVQLDEATRNLTKGIYILNSKQQQRKLIIDN